MSQVAINICLARRPVPESGGKRGYRGSHMLTIHEDRMVRQGFGCSYITTTRTWLLLGVLPVWRDEWTVRRAG